MSVARYVLAVAVMCLAPACECARVGAELCFEDEPCAQPVDAGLDAGAPDAGVDAGFDGGADAGIDAGVDGGDSPPPLSNEFPDAGICETFACIGPKLAPRLSAPPGFSLVRIPVTGITTSASCTQRFRGGVFLRDGRVLAVPYCANRFLIIDPAAQSAEPIGVPLVPSLDSTGAQVGSFAGGALGCDGLAWIAPYGRNEVLRARFSTSDGGLLLQTRTSSMLPSPVFAMGLAVGAGCSDFELWMPAAPVVARFELFLSMVAFSAVPIDALAPFAPAGVLRSERGIFLVSPANGGGTGVWERTVISGGLSGIRTVLVAGGDVRGGATGADEATYFVTSGTGETWIRRDADGGGETISVRPGPSGVTDAGYQWPAFRGDGFIYALGHSLLAIDESPDGGSFALLGPELADAGALLMDPFGGLVVTPSGLVAIPSEFPDVLLLVPDGGTTAPREVLLSPYFDKL